LVEKRRVGQLSTKYFRHAFNSEKLQKYYTVTKQQFQLEHSAVPSSSVTIQNNSALKHWMLIQVQHLIFYLTKP